MYQTVKTFVDDVYAGLCSNEFNLDITAELAEVFGMLAEDKPSTSTELQDNDQSKTQETYSINVNQENLGLKKILQFVFAYLEKLQYNNYLCMSIYQLIPTMV